jgi:hypothetical protein
MVEIFIVECVVSQVTAQFREGVESTWTDDDIEWIYRSQSAVYDCGFTGLWISRTIRVATRSSYDVALTKRVCPYFCDVLVMVV